MQNSSAFQFLAIDQIHESTTNPRQTFEESKLHELAESIRQHGLIQPITVRPNADGFEIVAGARRFRAAQLAELFALPARIVELNDAQVMEWQLVENSQRVDVHPYEEAQGFQRLLDLPGYDVAALVEKSGKSASHIYARLSLLQLIPEVAEAFTQERITASHANLIARLPKENQAAAFEQCWRKDWKDDEAHLLPARFLSAWIESNLYLSLAEAPFDRKDPTLSPAAGACTACPRRSGYNTSLFCDVEGDQCLDALCYQAKVAAHIEREIAARPELVQIETSWRSPKEQKPGILKQGAYRELDTPENPDAEPPCASTRTALIVYGKRVGTTTTICTDRECPVHDPRAAAHQQASRPVRVSTPEPAPETDDQQPEAEERRKEYAEEQERRAEERRQQFERQQEAYETECVRRAELETARLAMFDRILENAPATFSAAQLRVFLRALINLDPYTFTEDVAAHFAGEDENHQQTAEEVLLTTLDDLTDDKLTGFALRLALTGHTGIPREGELDLLSQAEVAFAAPQPQPRKTPRQKKAETSTPIKAAVSKKKVGKKAAA
jgi:ParB family chromosome partitioning protein